MSVRDIVQAAAGQGGGDKLYVDDVFSTYLYTGTGGALTVNNGIDLDGEGGMVWIKPRLTTDSHRVFSTGQLSTSYQIQTNTTNASSYLTNGGIGFLSNGFNLSTSAFINENGSPAVSWTFRKAPKFFDVVTYTGDGTTNRQIPHNLASMPGMIIVKRTNGSGNWLVWHQSINTTGGNDLREFLTLNTTAAVTLATTGVDRPWAAVSSESFGIAFDASAVTNINGATYVAYLFAHDAGGFGETGDDSIVACGSFTTNGSGIATVDLGWEPQFVLFKISSSTGSWRMYDNMRGIATGGNDAVLFPNLTAAEDTGSDAIDLTANGFNIKGQTASKTYIYLAIRRPNKPPESGTEVFNAETYTPTNVDGRQLDVGLNPDAYFWFRREGDFPWLTDRLRDQMLGTSSTASETTASNNVNTCKSNKNNHITIGATEYSPYTSANYGTSGRQYLIHAFKRAPGFFDVVCYTGTGSPANIAHNLGVEPNIVIIKRRDSTDKWWTYVKTDGFAFVSNAVAIPFSLETTTGAYKSSDASELDLVTSTTFSTKCAFFGGGYGDVSGANYVAYLFATLPGISKVGSYTGTGTTQQINCGFTTGARFVMIKRTDSTGDWYVWDTARGIVSGNDPYLRLNSTAAEVTSTDYIDPYSAGFEISSTAPAAINASGGSFIFYAVA